MTRPFPFCLLKDGGRGYKARTHSPALPLRIPQHLRVIRLLGQGLRRTLPQFCASEADGPSSRANGISSCHTTDSARNPWTGPVEQGSCAARLAPLPFAARSGLPQRVGRWHRWFPCQYFDTGWWLQFRPAWSSDGLPNSLKRNTTAALWRGVNV